MKNKLIAAGCTLALIFLVLLWLRWANDPIRTYATNYKQGEQFYKEGNYKKAIYFWEATLKQVEELAPESPDQTEVLTSLCVAYTEIEVYEKAQTACAKALLLSESLFGKQSIESVQLRWMLGRINREQNKSY